MLALEARRSVLAEPLAAAIGFSWDAAPHPILFRWTARIRSLIEIGNPACYVLSEYRPPNP